MLSICDAPRSTDNTGLGDVFLLTSLSALAKASYLGAKKALILCKHRRNGSCAVYDLSGYAPYAQTETMLPLRNTT